MKALSLALMIMVSLYLVIAAPMPAAAIEEGTGDSVDAGDDPSTSVAHGVVRVTVIEWKPDIEGVGAGLFTESEFDFSEFFGELCEAVASLLGI